MIMTRAPWEWTLDERIPSDVYEAKRIVDALLQQLELKGWSDEDRFGIHLSIEEALVNAIKHGNGGNPDKSVHVVIQLSMDFIFIQITDEGPGFNPAEVPDPTLEENLEVPSGRGLMLMRSFMTHVEYNEVGNKVKMEKARTT